MKTKDPFAAFDLGPVLDWLQSHQDTIRPRMAFLNEPAKPFLKIMGNDRIPLTAGQIGNVLNLFPPSCRKYSSFDHIKTAPETWFSRATVVPNSPKVTTVSTEALYPRAFVPGYTDIITWDNIVKKQFIQLYDLPSVSPEIAVWMSAHALIHEYVHTLISPLWYTAIRPHLRIAGGPRSVHVNTFMMSFAAAAAQVPAISHYAEAYRPLPSGSNDPEFIVNVGEELCESVVAYLLGQIYCDDESRQFDPFNDRPKVKDLVADFLNAEIIFEKKGEPD